MKKKVLLLGDNRIISHSIKFVLQDDATEIQHASSGNEALQSFFKHPYCLIIVDTHLPGTDILQMLKTMRQAKSTPILVLTEKLSPEERITLLEVGATACLQQPFDIAECVAQARSLMDLYTAANPVESRYHTLAFGTELIIDPTYWQVTLNGKQKELTRKEFDLLYCLASRAGQAVTHEQIYNQVWRSDSDINVEGTIKTHISSLRQKLSVGGREYIESVRGVGYRFIADG